MRRLPFAKMSAAGNDFIVIDSADLPRGARGADIARRLCPRARAVGADGLLILTRLPRGTARVDYFNADGTRAFCGNGTRAAALWVRARRWSGASFSLKTAAGELPCRVAGPSRARVRLKDPSPPRALALRVRGRAMRTIHIDTGAPHAVVRVPAGSLDAFDVAAYGAALRRHPAWGRAGANADFAAVKDGILRLRTYERGVEAETLACGTGVAAAALASGLDSPVRVVTRGGDRLTVSFKRNGSRFEDVWLEGPAEFVFTGEVTL